MRINVIIPSFNSDKYIKSAVNSVIKQSYGDLRIIIVDDGSEDSTKEICSNLSLKDKRIIYIYQNNSGVSSARNKGIDYVLKNKQGFEYIAFLDSDDLWCRDFFNDNVISRINEKHDLLCFETCRCTGDLKRATPVFELLETPFGEPAKEEYRILSGGASSVRCHENSHLGAIFYSADLLKVSGIRFFENLKYSEDKIFKIQCLYAAKKVALMKKLLYVYRINDASAMKTVKFDVNYYLPIISAYIECDRQMQYLKDTDAGELCWGRTLAALYTTEMIDIHFRSYKNESELKKILELHPEFIENLKDFASYDERIQNWIDKVKKNKQRYIKNQRIAGVKLFITETLKKNYVFKKIKDKKVFSLKNRYI